MLRWPMPAGSPWRNCAPGPTIRPERRRGGIGCPGQYQRRARRMGRGREGFPNSARTNPPDLSALSHLGTLLAKERKLNDGEALLDKAVDRNQDIRAWP